VLLNRFQGPCQIDGNTVPLPIAAGAVGAFTVLVPAAVTAVVAVVAVVAVGVPITGGGRRRVSRVGAAPAADRRFCGSPGVSVEDACD